jgi:hypothetical protein
MLEVVMKRLTVLFAVLLIASPTLAMPMKDYWTNDNCLLGDLTVDDGGAGNPTACQGVIDAAPGGANENTDVLNLTPIYTDATLTTVDFTGFFGFTDWNFAQKVDAPSSLSTNIDLGLTITQNAGTVDWGISAGALLTYTDAIAVIKQAKQFAAAPRPTSPARIVAAPGTGTGVSGCPPPHDGLKPNRVT